MNIGEWCIRNPSTTYAIAALVIVLGLITYFTIPRLEDPQFIVKVAVIITPFPGATPERVEHLVTDKIEKAVREIPEIETIESQSLPGLSIINLALYEKYRDIQPIWDRVRHKVNDIKGSLPPEAGTPFVNDEYSDVYGILLAITGDGYSYRELKDVADDVRKDLFHVKGVSKIMLFGTQEERIFIDFSNDKFAEYGFTPFAIAEVLKEQNTIASSGAAKINSERVILNTSGEFKSLEQIRNMEIAIPGKNNTVRIGDIANVWRGYEDPAAPMVFFNGAPAILVAISGSNDFNFVSVGERVLDEMNRIKADWPVGLNYQIITYQPKFITRSINQFIHNLIEAIVFVFIVMVLFTGIRSGLITGALIPITMLLCLASLPIFDVALQRVSIAAMIIALGIMVDNGVVMTENLLVRFSSGQDRVIAVSKSVVELWKPLLIASTTTIAAFVPIPLAKSDVGEYTLSIFIVLALALMYSWLFSLTIIPFLCFRFLKPKVVRPTYNAFFYRFYRNILIWALRNRPKFLIILSSVFILALYGLYIIPKSFFPPNEREMFLIDFWLPYGSDIASTAKQSQKLERFLLERPEIESVATFVGSGGPRWYFSLDPEETNPNYALFIVNTHTVSEVDPLLDTARNYLDTHFAGVTYTIKKLETGPFVGHPIQVRISGPDIKTLYRVSNEIKQFMRNVQGIFNISDDWGEWSKTLAIDVKQQQTKRAGYTSSDIATSLQSQISGYEATQYREGKEIIPILIRGDKHAQELGNIDSAIVYSQQNSQNIPLLQVASSKVEWQPSDIRRRNEVRTMTVRADVTGRYASQALDDLKPLIAKLQNSPQWPVGYKIEYGGEQEQDQRANASIFSGIPFALIAIVLLLMIEFNSIRGVAIIMLTVPMMVIGVTIGLLVTNESFGFMAMLGFVSLLGIVVHNGILLIDRIHIEENHGFPLPDAIVLAAHRRFRPIMATACITVISLIPLSLNGGELWRPMANTIIFGLMFNTILTLVLGPVLYSYFFKVKYKGYRWRQSLVDEEWWKQAQAEERTFLDTSIKES